MNKLKNGREENLDALTPDCPGPGAHGDQQELGILLSPWGVRSGGGVCFSPWIARISRLFSTQWVITCVVLSNIIQHGSWSDVTFFKKVFHVSL